MPSSNPNVQATFDRVMRMPESLPRGWRAIAVHAVGGLVGVAFDDAENSELLLVTSHQGRGVFDCTSGQRIARDADDGGAWEDPYRLRAAGIGPLAGKTLATAGLHGGGLPCLSRDGGWHVEPVYHDWPDACMVMSGPAGYIWLAERAASCHKVGCFESPRAFGFSWSGRTLIVAESHTLHIFGRAPATDR